MYGDTPLLSAARHNLPLEVITALIKAGADVNPGSVDADTPLMWAAGHSNLEVVTALAQAGADVNARGSKKITVLMRAVMPLNPNPEVITRLLEFGAEPKARNRWGEMAIDIAKKNESLKDTDALRKLEKVSRLNWFELKTRFRQNLRQ